MHPTVSTKAPSAALLHLDVRMTPRGGAGTPRLEDHHGFNAVQTSSYHSKSAHWPGPAFAGGWPLGLENRRVQLCVVYDIEEGDVGKAIVAVARLGFARIF